MWYTFRFDEETKLKKIVKRKRKTAFTAIWYMNLRNNANSTHGSWRGSKTSYSRFLPNTWNMWEYNVHLQKPGISLFWCHSPSTMSDTECNISFSHIFKPDLSILLLTYILYRKINNIDIDYIYTFHGLYHFCSNS